jgi:tetratricopeptide (TPR) repeat protein
MLGNLLVDSEDYRNALFRLEEALAKFPNSAESLPSKQKIAECYQRIGVEEIGKINESRAPASVDSHTRLAQESFNKAIVKYQEIEKLLRERKPKDKLKSEEQTILVLSSFGEAFCYRSLANRDKARELFRALAIEFNGRLDGIKALSWMYWCYMDEKNRKEARSILEKMSKVLKEMPDAAFTSSVDSSSRKEWQLWIEERKAEIDNPMK